MAEDLLAAVRRVRREVVDCMRVLMKYAKVFILYCCIYTVRYYNFVAVLSQLNSFIIGTGFAKGKMSF